MNNYILENYKEKSKHSFVQQYVRNVCAKFTVDPLSHFHTGACQVFTTQKLSSSEILLTMKTWSFHQIPFKHIFW